jgi:hypothetical protein
VSLTFNTLFNVSNSATYAATAMAWAIVPSTGAETLGVSWANSWDSIKCEITAAEYRTTGTWYNPPIDRWAYSANGATNSCPTGTTQATTNPNDLEVETCETSYNYATVTWGAVSGLSLYSGASTASTGWYDQNLSTTGATGTTIPLNITEAYGSVGIVASFGTTGGTAPTCVNCVHNQHTSSGASGAPSDPTSFTGTVYTGDLMVAFQWHTNWSGSGTTTVTDTGGSIWHPCSGTGTGAFTDIQVDATHGLSCNWAIYMGPPTTDGITIAASDCASNCTALGLWIGDYSGPLVPGGTQAWEAWGSHANATSSAGSTNNFTTGSATTISANDLILAFVYDSAGNVNTAGTSPITFTLRSGNTEYGEEGIYSTAGAINPTFNGTAGDPYGGITVAFK